MNTPGKTVKMETVEKYCEHTCRCGNVLEVKITLTGAGFEAFEHGGEETKYEYSFGNLSVEIAQKE